MHDFLGIVGAVVPVLSALASFVNQLIRNAQNAGKPVDPVLATTGVILNTGAVNVDKAVQLVKMMAAPKDAKGGKDCK